MHGTLLAVGTKMKIPYLYMDVLGDEDHEIWHKLFHLLGPESYREKVALHYNILWNGYGYPRPIIFDTA